MPGKVCCYCGPESCGGFTLDEEASLLAVCSPWMEEPDLMPDEKTACELCGDVDETMFLHARCHPTAPLRARKDGNVLILTCYLPECGREVVRLELAASD